MTIHALIRTLACAALVASVHIAFAEDPPQPEQKVDKKNDVKVSQDGPDAPKIKFIPAPATKPAVGVVKAKVSPEAQTLIDDIVAAYGKLKTLELAGDFTGDIEAAGQHTGGKIPFTASFESPNKFRHTAKDDILIGSNGDKAYAYASQDNLFARLDAPKDKVDTKDLPAGFREVLVDQNPSLRLALAKDAGKELIENAADIAKVDDTRINDKAYPTLKLTLWDKTSATLSVDPDTHLIRFAAIDVRAQLEERKIPDIKKAMYTVDYTTITPDALVKAEQFAWAPPAGAKDIKDIKEPPAAPGEQDSAMALIGKEVPDFKLPDLDGKTVSKKDLMGKVYILDFWATWCPPCRASLPHLDKLYQSQKTAGLQVFAVNLQEEKEKVQEFVTNTKLGLHILLDTEGKTSIPFKAEGIPETVVVGKDGKVVKVFVGFDPGTTPEELKKAVDKAFLK
jgi:peroxiredoxin